MEICRGDKEVQTQGVDVPYLHKHMTKHLDESGAGDVYEPHRLLVYKSFVIQIHFVLGRR